MNATVATNVPFGKLTVAFGVFASLSVLLAGGCRLKAPVDQAPERRTVDSDVIRSVEQIPKSWLPGDGLDRGPVVIDEFDNDRVSHSAISLRTGQVTRLISGFSEGAFAPNRRWFADNEVTEIELWPDVREPKEGQKALRPLRIKLQAHWGVHKLIWPKPNQLLALTYRIDSTPTKLNLVSIDPLSGAVRSLFETSVAERMGHPPTPKKYGVSGMIPPKAAANPLDLQLGNGWIFVSTARKSFLIDPKNGHAAEIETPFLQLRISPDGRYAAHGTNADLELYKIKPRLTRIKTYGSFSGGNIWFGPSAFFTVELRSKDGSNQGRFYIGKKVKTEYIVDQYLIKRNRIRKTGSKAKAYALRLASGNDEAEDDPNLSVSSTGEDVVLYYSLLSKQKQSARLYLSQIRPNASVSLS